VKFLFFMFSLILFSASHAATIASLIGNWRVTSLLDAAPIADMTREEAKKRVVGKDLIFKKSSITLGADVCQQPILTEAKKKTFDLFYHGYRADPVNLRLPENVTEISVNCKNDSEVDNFYTARKDRLVFYWHGFFFEAVRVKSK
jgi:hypothetical protein